MAMAWTLRTFIAKVTYTTGKKKLCSDYFTSENHTYTDNILVRSSDDQIQEKFT